MLSRQPDPRAAPFLFHISSQSWPLQISPLSRLATLHKLLKKTPCLLLASLGPAPNRTLSPRRFAVFNADPLLLSTMAMDFSDALENAFNLGGLSDLADSVSQKYAAAAATFASQTLIKSAIQAAERQLAKPRASGARSPPKSRRRPSEESQWDLAAKRRRRTRTSPPSDLRRRSPATCCSHSCRCSCRRFRLRPRSHSSRPYSQWSTRCTELAQARGARPRGRLSKGRAHVWISIGWHGTEQVFKPSHMFGCSTTASFFANSTRTLLQRIPTTFLYHHL